MARLVFLGTPEAAVAPLRTLVDAGHQVALVVSRPDTRRGRGPGLAPSPVKAAATDLGVVVAYGRIIPVAVLDRLPMVNLHFSLLPRWRGAAPVERAILEGDAETGVCLMAVEAGLDTGAVYAEAQTEIGEEETADELRSRLVVIGCRLLVDTLAQGLHGLPVARDQAGEPSYAEKILPSELELRWEQPGTQIRRVIRLGRAWTTFRGRRLTVLSATGTTAEGEPGSDQPRRDGDGAGGHGDPHRGPGSAPPGSLLGTDVVTGDGSAVRLITVQPEGRRAMDAAAWVRGVRPGPTERLGA